MLSLILGTVLSFGAPSSFAARGENSNSTIRPTSERTEGGRRGLELRDAAAPISPDADFSLELSGIPEIVELPIVGAADSSEISWSAGRSRATGDARARGESRSRLGASVAAVKAVEESGDNPQAFVDQMSKWIGEAGLKAGYADFKDGTRLHFAFRKGVGPAVLVVHGRAIGPEGFQNWSKEMFPGRPVLFLQRRGYSGEERHITPQEVYPLHSSDVEKAISLARRLGNGGKVGIITHSLGAMLLPDLDPKKVAWLALLNPGVYGIFRETESMPTNMFEDFFRGDLFAAWKMWSKVLELMQSNTNYAFTGEMAQLMSAGDFATRWLPPAVVWRNTFLNWSSRVILTGVEERLRAMHAERGALTDRLLGMLKDRERSRFWKEAMFSESLWAALAYMDYAPWGKEIPVFLGTNTRDELIKRFIFKNLRDELLDGRIEDLTFKWIEMEGGHTHPLMQPRPWQRALHGFVEKLESHLAGK